MSNGGSLSTKGLVSGAGAGVTVEVEAELLPPPDALSLGTDIPQRSLMIVVPTAVNLALMAAENITDNMRVRQPASLGLPSLYKRAYLVAHETDEIAVLKGK